MHRCIRNGGKTTQCVPAELSINSAMTFFVSSACPARMRLVRPKRVLHTLMCTGSGLTLRSTTRPAITTLPPGQTHGVPTRLQKEKKKLSARFGSGLRQISVGVYGLAGPMARLTVGTWRSVRLKINKQVFSLTVTTPWVTGRKAGSASTRNGSPHDAASRREGRSRPILVAAGGSEKRAATRLFSEEAFGQASKGRRRAGYLPVRAKGAPSFSTFASNTLGAAKMISEPQPQL